MVFQWVAWVHALVETFRHAKIVQDRVEDGAKSSNSIILPVK